MTAAATQRIMDIAETLPNEAEEPIINFMIQFKSPEKPDVSKRIGIAEGEFEVLEDFDAGSEEIYQVLMECAL